MENELLERRKFLKNTLYAAPVLISLGSLEAEATNNSSGNTHYSSRSHGGNYNGGNHSSCGHCGGNHSGGRHCGASKLYMTDRKRKVHNMDVKNRYGGHDNDYKKWRNNGWGNGDQDAPGNSLPHNNAENSQHNSKKSFSMFSNSNSHTPKWKVNSSMSGNKSWYKGH